MELSGERLLLREFTEGDFQLYYSVFSSDQVMRYAWIDKLSREDAEVNFQKVLGNNAVADNRIKYEFAVFSACDGSFIGFADIEVQCRNPFGGSAEIGYFLLPGAWGRGYATEIANTLITYCFTSLRLHRVTARCNANNLASENVMKKAGMAWDGTFRQARYKNGGWDDEKHYAILKQTSEQEACNATI